jgi:hypothetical protein
MQVPPAAACARSTRYLELQIRPCEGAWPKPTYGNVIGLRSCYLYVGPLLPRRCAICICSCCNPYW